MTDGVGRGWSQRNLNRRTMVKQTQHWRDRIDWLVFMRGCDRDWLTYRSPIMNTQCSCVHHPWVVARGFEGMSRLLSRLVYLLVRSLLGYFSSMLSNDYSTYFALSNLMWFKMCPEYRSSMQLSYVRRCIAISHLLKQDEGVMNGRLQTNDSTVRDIIALHGGWRERITTVSDTPSTSANGCVHTQTSSALSMDKTFTVCLCLGCRVGYTNSREGERERGSARKIGSWVDWRDWRQGVATLVISFTPPHPSCYDLLWRIPFFASPTNKILSLKHSWTSCFGGYIHAFFAFLIAGPIRNWSKWMRVCGLVDITS